MKQIDLFLIEKLKINKDTKPQYSGDDIDWVKVNIPKCNSYDGVVNMKETWKTFELPKSTYIIFKDMYRGHYPHFADTGDLLGHFCYNQDDYEDFNPKKDILYASNDLRDIMQWYFKYLEIDELPKDEDDIDAWADKYEDTERKMNDNLAVLGKIYLGVDDWYDGYKEYTWSKKEIEKDCGTYFDLEY